MEFEADVREARPEPAISDAAPFTVLGGILADARRRNATHVHVEPGGAVRLRVGGRLIEAAQLAPALLPTVLEELGEANAALLTGQEGTRAVLHLGVRDPAAQALERLGMSHVQAARLGTVLERTSGLVLVAGPAGSGISTTLDTLRGLLDDGSRNLMVLDADASAERLGEILRQDPDVVLVESLADRRTATLAAQAAESQLVLAGVEADNAVAAILRLRALRLEPFQLASVLRVVLAQRVVRRLCQACREPMQARGSVSALLGFDPGAVVYAPVGCESCTGGFAGETGVFEAVHADAAIRRLINDGGDEAILARHAFLNAPNLGSAARALVREGMITPDEAVRISRG